MDETPETELANSTQAAVNSVLQRTVTPPKPQSANRLVFYAGRWLHFTEVEVYWLERLFYGHTAEKYAATWPNNCPQQLQDLELVGPAGRHEGVFRLTGEGMNLMREVDHVGWTLPGMRRTQGYQ